MKKNIFIIILIIIGFIIAIGFLPMPNQYSKKAVAAFNFGLLGGQIQSIRVCTCSNSQLLTIGPPASGDFLFQFGISKLFSFYSIKIGSKVLGLAAPTPIACMVYAGTGCVSQGQGKPILIIGTSR